MSEQFELPEYLQQFEKDVGSLTKSWEAVKSAVANDNPPPNTG